MVKKIGDDTAEVMLGSAGADVLLGNGGNDTISGYGDVDQLFGGLGSDKLFGGAGDDFIIANEGNDFIDGGSGRDYMNGGFGNDTYIVDNTLDKVTELPGQGIDVVRSSVSFGLSAGVEKLVLTGTASVNGSGNGVANGITGNSGDNELRGYGGRDTLWGGAGADILKGGASRDWLKGGTGADVFVYSAESDSKAGVLHRDYIRDFTGGEDKIDLSAIDGSTASAGQDTLLDSQISSSYNAAAQVTIIQINIFKPADGTDSIIDMEIVLAGQHTLTAADFIL